MKDPEKLRRAFDSTLKTIWQEWADILEREGIPRKGMNPFQDLEEVTSLLDHAGFNQDLGWLTGVHDATGWPLDRPLGPKQWSPKENHPPESRP